MEEGNYYRNNTKQNKTKPNFPELKDVNFMNSCLSAPHNK